jgi:hypothetical protein
MKKKKKTYFSYAHTYLLVNWKGDKIPEESLAAHPKAF